MEVDPAQTHPSVLVIELAVPEGQLLVEVAQDAIDCLREKIAEDPRFVALHLGIDDVAERVLGVFSSP